MTFPESAAFGDELGKGHAVENSKF
jgi:hypothetical protein